MKIRPSILVSPIFSCQFLDTCSLPFRTKFPLSSSNRISLPPLSSNFLLLFSSHVHSLQWNSSPRSSRRFTNLYAEWMRNEMRPERRERNSFQLNGWECPWRASCWSSLSTTIWNMRIEILESTSSLSLTISWSGNLKSIFAAQPQFRAIITHGGWSSILESLYVGRPMILMPLFGGT